MKKIVAYLLLAVTAQLLVPSRAQSNGVVRDSIGATSSGRGGTNLAHHDNGAVILNNPAAMVNVKGSGLSEFGVDTVITDLDYSDPENNTSAVNTNVLPEISVIRKSLDGRWAVGFGAFAPAGYGATWKLSNPILGTNTYKSFGALGKIMPGVAYQVNDDLSIGASMGVAISHLEFESPFFLQTGPLAGAPTQFDLQATGASLAWNVGLQYQLDEWTTIGAGFIGETRMEYDGNVRAAVVGLGPQPIESRFDAEVDLAWPRSAGVGVAHWLNCRQRISTDLMWYDWSNAYDQLDIRLRNSTNPIFPAVLGPEISDSFPLRWRDSLSVRLGYELFTPNDSVFRAGYVYNTRNLPSATLTPLIPATLEHSFTVGYGKSWSDWQWNFAYQFSFGPERSVGTSALAGGDFSNSESNSQAHWISLSLIRRF
ncbi:Outer membrane protein transport protein (OMPP1/FadL/TodX) [Symmachiella dynata]|uniref:OmpP1/FadL family transporter n=1 Tax=Symmachiella dynata TaxID=2527995 RepID=UPI0011890132|nr:outer membrane protein transport protein [Symmachiella dynata]QDT49091.1 Outer membrane protein transport protein (OMPP1/FadL/TodX) [Symmachiella dynata]